MLNIMMQNNTTKKLMSNKKQTVIDILISQLKEQIIKSAHHDAATIRTGDYRIGLSKAIELCDQAKEMEKQQIKDAFVECWKLNVPDGVECKLDAEQYYKETYEQ